MKVLTKDKSVRARARAAVAMATVGEPEDIDSLEECASVEPDEMVENEILMAVRVIRSPMKAPSLQNENAESL